MRLTLTLWTPALFILIPAPVGTLLCVLLEPHTYWAGIVIGVCVSNLYGLGFLVGRADAREEAKVAARRATETATNEGAKR